MCSLCNIVISLRRNNFKKDLDEKNFVDWFWQRRSFQFQLLLEII